MKWMRGHRKGVVMLFWLAAAAPAPAVELGDTYKEVVAELGEPGGEMNAGGKRALSYPGGVIKIKDGKVIYIDPDFARKTRQAEARLAYEEAQRAKGLIPYEGRWVTPEEKARIETVKMQEKEALRQKKARQAAMSRIRQHKPGHQEMDLNEVLVPGHVNVFWFYNEHLYKKSRNTVLFIRELQRFVLKDGQVYLHVVEVLSKKTGVFKQFKFRGLPMIWVFSPDGTRVTCKTKTLAQVMRCVEDAKK